MTKFEFNFYFHCTGFSRTNAGYLHRYHFAPQCNMQLINHSIFSATANVYMMKLTDRKSNIVYTLHDPALFSLLSKQLTPRLPDVYGEVDLVPPTVLCSSSVGFQDMWLASSLPRRDAIGISNYTTNLMFQFDFLYKRRTLKVFVPIFEPLIPRRCRNKQKANYIRPNSKTARRQGKSA